MMLLLIAALVIGQVADFLTFCVMVETLGIQAELNPLVIWLYTNFGLASVFVMKAGVIAYCSAAIRMLYPNSVKLARFISLSGLFVGSIGAASNILVVMS